MSDALLKNVRAPSVRGSDVLLKVLALQGAAPVVQALNECDEELRAEAVTLFKQLNSGTLDDDERFATAALLAEILFPPASRNNSRESEEDEGEGAEDERSESNLAVAMDQEEATFAERLRRLLEQKGMTQAQVAEKLGVGQPAIAMMLQRRCRPQRRTVIRLAEALGVAPEELWPIPRNLETMERGSSYASLDRGTSEPGSPVGVAARRFSGETVIAGDLDDQLKSEGKEVTMSEVPNRVGNERTEAKTNYYACVGDEVIGAGESLDLLCKVIRLCRNALREHNEDIAIWEGNKLLAIVCSQNGGLRVFAKHDTGFMPESRILRLLQEPEGN